MSHITGSPIWLSKFLKYSSITNYLSALKNVLKAEGSDPIDYSSHTIKTVMGGTKRTLGCSVKRDAPLLPGELLKIFTLMSDSVGHVGTRAAILTRFKALLWKSQLTDSDAVLVQSDFTFFSWGMLLTIRWTKTIQFKERELVIPVAHVPKHKLCTVYWVKRHFEQAQVGTNDPAFQVPAPGDGFRALDYRTLQTTILCRTRGS